MDFEWILGWVQSEKTGSESKFSIDIILIWLIKMSLLIEHGNEHQRSNKMINTFCMGKYACCARTRHKGRYVRVVTGHTSCIICMYGIFILLSISFSIVLFYITRWRCRGCYRPFLVF